MNIKIRPAVREDCTRLMELVHELAEYEKAPQEVTVDTGSVSLRVSYYSFATKLSNPPGGFSTVVSRNTTNSGTEQSQWATLGKVTSYGCSQSTYRFSIGFKPNYRGAYSLLLTPDLLLESCPGKMIPYHASLNYHFVAPDLNEDLFNRFADKVDLSADQRKYFRSKLLKKEMFAFIVE